MLLAQTAFASFECILWIAREADNFTSDTFIQLEKSDRWVIAFSRAMSQTDIGRGNAIRQLAIAFVLAKGG